MNVGMIGLGKMGANMAERLRRHGHTVVGMDPAKPDAEAHTLDELVPLLDAPGQPRVAWSMVPAGPITDQTIQRLGELLSAGDLVVDGGNSNYLDSIRHGEELAAMVKLPSRRRTVDGSGSAGWGRAPGRRAAPDRLPPGRRAPPAVARWGETCFAASS